VGRKERERKGVVDGFISIECAALKSETVVGRSRTRGVYDDGVVKASGEAATGAVEWRG
jgi:hypothetical protein